MMTSLMSIFDPSPRQSSLFGIDFFFYSVFFIFFFPFSNFWKFKSPLFCFFQFFLSLLFNSLKSKKFLIITSSVFLFVLFFNFSGLLPLSFCLTSQFFFHFFFGSVIWLSAVFFLFSKKKNVFFSHFTPQGSPLSLSFLLIPIELISMLIRPIALSLRLMANMIAGHMILALLEEGIFSLFFLPSWTFCFFFTIFEIGVSMIQTYVFSSLLYLYWKENLLN